MSKLLKRLICLAITVFVILVALQYLFPTTEGFVRYTTQGSQGGGGPNEPPGGGPGGGPPGMPKFSVTKGPPVAAMRGQGPPPQ